MSEAINFPHLGIYLDHVGKSFSVFGIEIASLIKGFLSSNVEAE